MAIPTITWQPEHSHPLRRGRFRSRLANPRSIETVVIVVSNTSPITNLAAIGQLDLLRQMYQQVIIPECVFRELTTDGGMHPGAIVRQLDWIVIRAVSNPGLVTDLQ